MILIGIAVNALFTGLSQGLGFSGSALTQSMSQVMTSTLTMKKWSDVEVIAFIWNDWPRVSVCRLFVVQLLSIRR